MSPSGRWVFKESQRAGGGGSYSSVLVMVEDSRRFLSSRGWGRPGLWAATSPSLRMRSQIFFIVPASPWMAQFNRKRKVFPKPQLGGGGGRRRWGFSPSSSWKIRLQSIKEAVKGHREHDRDPRLMERGRRVLGSPAALAISVSMCGNAGVVVTLEMLESQVGWGDKSQPHPWAQDLCHPGPLETGLAVLIPPAPHGTGRLMGTDPETMQALFTSSGPGRWHTLSRMARAWGLAAYGPG